MTWRRAAAFSPARGGDRAGGGVTATETFTGRSLRRHDVVLALLKTAAFV